MTAPVIAKLLVDDEVAMASYYKAVYGFRHETPVEGDFMLDSERFREVILATEENMGGALLVVCKLPDRPKPRDQQVVLGFSTDNIEELIERILANGGTLVGPARELPDFGIRVQFSADPEGALAENVQRVTG